jgi:1-acyl-sn-glycerol-3-phosphate acyltransferase
MAQRATWKRIWYASIRVVSRMLFIALFRYRAFGREHLPAAGGALVLSNHQSHFDPVLVGMACDRRLNYLARQTLFRFFAFRWLIESLDAIPIDRDGLGIGGLKETLRRLRGGELVLIFPEGTRTSDGTVAPLKPGFSALAGRARVPLVPVAIDGAFDVWPRWRKFPRLVGRIHVHVGPPMLPEEMARYDDRQLVAEVERRIRACHAAARQSLARAAGTPPHAAPALRVVDTHGARRDASA